MCPTTYVAPELKNFPTARRPTFPPDEVNLLRFCVLVMVNAALWSGQGMLPMQVPISKGTLPRQ